MSAAATSGIHVLEGAAAGAAIAVRRETVTAFVGPTPRGPADMPVAIRSLREFHRRFGCPDTPSRMQDCLADYFAAGGDLAIVVRVSDPSRRARLELPGPGGGCRLLARCPGSRELLRAAVDHDGLTDGRRFNLVVQRLASAGAPLVAEQESFRGLSIDPLAENYVGDALLGSRLVSLAEAPAERPAATPLTAAGVPRWVPARRPAANPAPGDYELIGSAADGTGLHALEQLPRLDLLCLLPAAGGGAIGPVAMFAAERYCRRRQALLLVDPPPDWDSVHAVATDTALRGIDSPNVASYFPRPAAGSLLGAIAGALAAADRESGPWHWPPGGGLWLPGAMPLAPRLDSRDVRILARFGVNALRRDPRGRLRVEGLVTRGPRLGLPPESVRLPARRTALFALGGIARGSRWSLFRPPDDYSRAELRRQLHSFLGRLHRAGGLQGRRAGEAWYLNGPDPVAGGWEMELGLALLQPRAFQAWRLRLRGADCELRELGWQPSLAMAG